MCILSVPGGQNKPTLLTTVMQFHQTRKPSRAMPAKEMFGN